MNREQKPKVVTAGRNERWMRERLNQANTNKTVPSKKRVEDRRRRPKHMGRGWES